MMNLPMRMSFSVVATAIASVLPSSFIFAATETIDPNVASEVVINNSGFNLTTAPFSLDVIQDPANDLEKKSFLEFSLGSLTPTTLILDATLDLSVTFAGQGAIPVYGYAGDGVADLSDSIVPTNGLIGTSEVITTDSSTVTVGLDVDFIQGLLGSATHLGVLLLGSENSMETTFGQLGVAPATLNLTVPDDGDFNGDGVVTGFDFLAWQRGESPNPNSASDLAEWETAYGSSLVGAVGAVPEPTTGALLALAMLLGVTRRDK